MAPKSSMNISKDSSGIIPKKSAEKHQTPGTTNEYQPLASKNQ
jgi:hypothetical protein